MLESPILCGKPPLDAGFTAKIDHQNLQLRFAGQTLLGILGTSVQIALHLAKSINTSFFKVTRIDFFQMEVTF